MLHRRYLCSFHPGRILHRFADVAVVGTGIAGLRSALEISGRSSLSVTIFTKNQPTDCNTARAQGGIAAPIAAHITGDSTESHVEDTLRTGCGLCNPEIVRLTVEEGVKRVEELIDWGAEFDRREGALHFTREGGHSFPRILHAQGDATGKVVQNVLLGRLRNAPSIQIVEDTHVLDILTNEDGCIGLLTFQKNIGKVLVWARAVILASGGYGQLFRETTNVPYATGDGVAMAYRAGVKLRDLEFIQFHPTTLYVAGAERVLITEAARGEGGILTDNSGNRFMTEYHPRAELAPRDIVARAILNHMYKTQQPRVYLDLTGIGGEKLRRRFPGVVSICRHYGIDPAEEPVPVRPSAHYTIGGVSTDSWGRTSLPNLYACGETACTGLHGANRLGSNSLLEGLVFGYRTAQHVVEGLARTRKLPYPQEISAEPKADAVQMDMQDMRRSLENLMVRNVGIIRSKGRLKEAGRLAAQWSQYAGQVEFPDERGWELQNMLLLALLVTEASLWRAESRGTHFREDFPKENSAYATSQFISRNENEDKGFRSFTAPSP